jgi:hypothetical protein
MTEHNYKMIVIDEGCETNESAFCCMGVFTYLL